MKRLNEWERLINSHQNDWEFQKLQVVNDFLESRIKETADWDEAKGNDYWQSPIETLVLGSGDCDDFAMAKYVSLRLLGITAEQLRIGLVEHPYLGGHGVVFFYPLNERDPWVLDNMESDRLGAGLGRIQRLSVRVRFDQMKPLWGVNENVLTRFDKSLNETLTLKNPCDEFPAFATALANSQRVLPLNDMLHLTHASTIHETWRGER
ncbi:MAG: transglutaminase-like cysteine peptidase [bacterium]